MLEPNSVSDGVAVGGKGEELESDTLAEGNGCASVAFPDVLGIINEDSGVLVESSLVEEEAVKESDNVVKDDVVKDTSESVLEDMLESEVNENDRNSDSGESLVVTELLDSDVEETEESVPEFDAIRFPKFALKELLV